jgi:hypothetical protein
MPEVPPWPAALRDGPLFLSDPAEVANHGLAATRTANLCGGELVQSVLPSYNAVHYRLHSPTTTPMAAACNLLISPQISQARRVR